VRTDRAHYPKAGNGRPAFGLKRMLRMYFLQQWFNLSDPGVEGALYDSAALRQFVGIDLGRRRCARRGRAKTGTSG
jgi:transposase, IS5 family